MNEDRLDFRYLKSGNEGIVSVFFQLFFNKTFFFVILSLLSPSVS